MRIDIEQLFTTVNSLHEQEEVTAGCLGPKEEPSLRAQLIRVKTKDGTYRQIKDLMWRSVSISSVLHLLKILIVLDSELIRNSPS